MKPMVDEAIQTEERVIVDGDKLLAGGQSFPLNSIRDVKLIGTLSDSYWRWVLYSFGILISTGVLTVAIVLCGVLAGIAFKWTSPPFWDWLLFTVFLLGAVMCFAVFMYGRRANPVEWHVYLDLGHEKREVYTSKARENAFAYANRIRRRLAHK